MSNPTQSWPLRYTEVDLGYTSPCHLWAMKPDPNGYGQVSIAGRHAHVHRLSYQLFIGAVPKGYEIDHLCHSASTTCPGGPTCLHRRCLNPRHLSAVPHAVNSRRSQNVTRLTADDVRDIRASTDIQADIAKAYGVHQSEVSRIKARKRWADVG